MISVMASVLTVFSTSSALTPSFRPPPASLQLLTMLEDMAERKIRPASCTEPMANGSREPSMKEAWCTMQEKKTSLSSTSMYCAKKASLKMIWV